MLRLKLQYFGCLIQFAGSKFPDAGKDREQKEKVSENEMAGQHH